MNLLAIESSCDETSAAVVRMEDDGTDRTPVREILSNKIASQAETHALYGGVVPEIASRAHTEAISSLTYGALSAASLKLEDIGAVCVTASPGLIGALLVGVNFAKALAYANGLPLIPVNHIRGHIAANYLAYGELRPPFLALVASGGHTSLMHVKTYTSCETIGQTRDDAIGEAFDKAARVMGIPYPGGAVLDRLAAEGRVEAVRFPSAAIADGTLDFSFSGIKTAVINYIHSLTQRGEPYDPRDIAAALTESVVRSVLKKLETALERTGLRTFVLTGGVAANSHLRRAAEAFCRERNVRCFLPPLSLCGDNAAMIGAQGYYEYLAGVRGDAALDASATERTFPLRSRTRQSAL